MSREARKHKVHLAAMAILVADDVIDRRAGIDLLLDYEARRHPTPEQKAAWPKGYATARAMAMHIDRGDMPYSDGELHVAAVIDGGTYTTEGMDKAARYLSRALSQRDERRAEVAKELQAAIVTPIALDALIAPPPAPQKPVEAAQPVARVSAPRTIMRPPARPV